MQTLKKTALIALFLLPVFFLLHNYNEIFGFILIKQIIKYTVVVYALMIVSYFIILRITASNTKSALIIFVLSFFFLFFGPIHSLIKLIAFKTVLGTYKFLLPFSCIILILLIRKIVRSTQISAKTIMFLNVVMICLVSTEIITSFVKGSEYLKDGNLIYPSKKLCKKYISKNLSDSSKPDIYFLVFDEYTNNKALKKLWDFNNDSITNWLAKEGFYIPGNTKANYTSTPYSISSTLNMDYIYDSKKSTNATVPTNVLQSVKSISDNETFCILKKEQYSIRFLAPFRNSFEENKLEHYFDNLADDQLWSQTLPGSIESDILWNFKSGKWKILHEKSRNDTSGNIRFNSILATINQVEATSNQTKNRKPQFIYGHFLITHHPHIFDSTGKLMSWEKEQPPLYKTYTSQIKYANKVMQEIVSHIKQNNRRNTIIIIEGDHGFREWHGPEAWVPFPNFSAIYFPDKNYSLLYDSISPLNMFRMIFNQYFYQDFPLLNDSSIFVKDSKS